MTMVIKYWLANPKKLAARLRYRVWEWQHPELPWLCPGTVAFCERHLTREMTAVEFGSGRSTAWFATKVGKLTSVEHAAEWHRQVDQRLARHRGERRISVDYRFVPLDHPEEVPERLDYGAIPAYVAVLDEFADRSLDLVIVDGHYRTNCILRALPKLKPGGYLLVDDINMWPSLEDIPVPPNWPRADDSTNGVKRCVIWRAP